MLVNDIDMSSAINQHRHYGPMTCITCHMQRSESIAVSDIDINSAIKQHPHDGLITLFTCIMQETRI
jgi:hypothetical protein